MPKIPLPNKDNWKVWLVGAAVLILIGLLWGPDVAISLLGE